MRIPTNEEYDRMVKTTGGEDVKIHWANNYSWVNSAIEHCFHSLHRAVRGYYSASNWVNITTSQYVNAVSRLKFLKSQTAWGVLPNTSLEPGWKFGLLSGTRHTSSQATALIMPLLPIGCFCAKSLMKILKKL